MPGMPTIPIAEVGDPASIRYHTMTRAAVVVGVTPRSVKIRRVEVGPSRQDMMCDPGAYGVRPSIEDGILDRPIEGTDEVFRWSDAHGAFRHGGCSLRLGVSRNWTDWRD